MPSVLVPSLALLLCLEDGLHFRVAGRPVFLLFCCASFARESVTSLLFTLQCEGIHCRVTLWLLQRRQGLQIGRFGQWPCLTEGPAGRTRHLLGGQHFERYEC